MIMSLLLPTKSNLAALSLAIITVWASVSLSSMFHRQALELLPASHWLEVKHLDVASHSVDEMSVPLVYDHVAHEAIFARWYAEIDNADTNVDVCDGSGESHVAPNDKLPVDNIVKLEWYMGHKCDLPAGRYVLKSFYRIYAEEDVVKTFTVISNIFKVTDAATASTQP